MSSIQLLDKTRKINKLLHNNNSQKVVFNDICKVLTEVMNSNVLVISKKGKILGKNEADKYVFKAPSLRNIEKTGPYFHDGSVKSLAEAIKIMSKLQNNKELSNQEVEEMIAFLKTLTADVDPKYKQ